MNVLGHSSPVDPFMRMPSLHGLAYEFVRLADGRVDGPESALNYIFLVICCIAAPEIFYQISLTD